MRPGLWVGLADLVVWVHLGWIALLVFGVFVGRRFRWVRRLHLAGLGLAVVLTALGWLCPLTHLEVWLRQQGGAAGYSGTFLGRLAEGVVYAPVPRWAVLAAAVVWTGFTAIVYARAARSGRRCAPGLLPGRPPRHRTVCCPARAVPACPPERWPSAPGR